MLENLEYFVNKNVCKMAATLIRCGNLWLKQCHLSTVLTNYQLIPANC